MLHLYLLTNYVHLVYLCIGKVSVQAKSLCRQKAYEQKWLCVHTLTDHFSHVNEHFNNSHRNAATSYSPKQFCQSLRVHTVCGNQTLSMYISPRGWHSIWYSIKCEPRMHKSNTLELHYSLQQLGTCTCNCPPWPNVLLHTAILRSCSLEDEQ